MKRWMIVQTRPRWEKKVKDSLLSKGIECFCPINKVKRKWSDRIKIVQEPLFKNLLLVKIGPADKAVVRTTPGVVNFIYRDRKIVSVREKQVQVLRMFLDVNGEVEMHTSLNNTDGEHKVNGHNLHGRKSIRLEIDNTTYLLVSNKKEEPSLNCHLP